LTGISVQLKLSVPVTTKRDAYAEVFPLNTQSTHPLFIFATAPLITVSSLIF